MNRLKVKVYPRDGLVRQRSGKALIEISVKSQVTETLSLAPDTFDWTRKHLGAFDVVVGDYLSRHNYQAFGGANETVAITEAMRDGQQIAARLSHLISESPSQDARVISAGSLYGDASFCDRFVRFEHRYAEHAGFKLLIDQAVDAFLVRKLRDATPGDNVRSHCIAYQLEELVLFELLTEAGYGALVYAGPHLPVMKSIVSGSLGGVSLTLETLTLVELRIANTK